ncbi:hypothetical protein AMECASPLE_028991, partial [Ameca splendens]
HSSTPGMGGVRGEGHQFDGSNEKLTFSQSGQQIKLYVTTLCLPPSHASLPFGGPWCADWSVSSHPPYPPVWVIETRASSCQGLGHHVIEFCLVSWSATKHGTGHRGCRGWYLSPTVTGQEAGYTLGKLLFIPNKIETNRTDNA